MKRARNFVGTTKSKVPFRQIQSHVVYQFLQDRLLKLLFEVSYRFTGFESIVVLIIITKITVKIASRFKDKTIIREKGLWKIVRKKVAMNHIKVY